MLKAPDQTNSLSKINEIQQSPPLLDAIESNKIVEPLGKKLDRIDLIDDQKEKIKAAAIIGADAVFRLLGKPTDAFKFEWVGNETMAREALSKRSELENIEEMSLYRIGAELPGYFDFQTATLCINIESPRNESSVDALITGIHETLHAFGIELDPGKYQTENRFYEKFTEGAQEYLSHVIAEAICNDSIELAQIAYAQSFNFFDQLGTLVGKNELANAILSGNIDKVELLYSESIKNYDLVAPPFKDLMNVYERLPLPQGPNQRWDSSAATEVLGGLITGLVNSNVLLNDQNVDLELIAQKGISFKQNIEPRARAFVELMGVMKAIVPGNEYYLSSDLGILSYDKPAGSIHDVQLVDFGTSWADSIRILSSDALIGASVSASSAKQNIPDFSSENGYSKRIKTNDPELYSKAISQKLLLREISLDEFKKIRSSADLIDHIKKEYPKTSEYNLQLFIKSAEVTMKTESIFGFIPDQSSIAKRIYDIAQNYQDEYLVLGNLNDLAMYMIKQTLKKLTKKTLTSKVVEKFNRSDKKCTSESLVGIPEELGIQKYNPKNNKELWVAIGYELKDIYPVNEFFWIGNFILSKFGIFEPTNFDICLTLHAFFSYNSKYKKLINKRLKTDQLYHLTKNSLWEYFDLGVKVIKDYDLASDSLPILLLNNQSESQILEKARKFFGD